jgi:hypothetical protein
MNTHRHTRNTHRGTQKQTQRHSKILRDIKSERYTHIQTLIYKYVHTQINLGTY